MKEGNEKEDIAINTSPRNGTFTLSRFFGKR